MPEGDWADAGATSAGVEELGAVASDRRSWSGWRLILTRVAFSSVASAAEWGELDSVLLLIFLPVVEEDVPLLENPWRGLSEINSSERCHIMQGVRRSDFYLAGDPLLSPFWSISSHEYGLARLATYRMAPRTSAVAMRASARAAAFLALGRFCGCCTLSQSPLFFQ